MKELFSFAVLAMTRHQFKIAAVVGLTVAVGIVLVWMIVRFTRRNPQPELESEPQPVADATPPFHLSESEIDTERGRTVDPGLAHMLSKAAAREGDARTTADLVEGALKVVTDLGGVSVPALQRRLEIDFDRATEIVHKLEAEGYVSEPGAHGRRKVLKPAYDYVTRVDSESDEA